MDIHTFYGLISNDYGFLYALRTATVFIGSFFVLDWARTKQAAVMPAALQKPLTYFRYGLTVIWLACFFAGLGFFLKYKEEAHITAMEYFAAPEQKQRWETCLKDYEAAFPDKPFKRKYPHIVTAYCDETMAAGRLQSELKR